jgi:hypothetical protein
MPIPFKLDMMLCKDGNAYPIVELRTPEEAVALRDRLMGHCDWKEQPPKSSGVLVRIPIAYKASLMENDIQRGQVEETFSQVVEHLGYSLCSTFEGETPKPVAVKDPRIIRVKGRDYKLKAGECACDGCRGDGIYRGAGGVENGVFKGFTGPCYRCGQKGYQTHKDQCRNRYYDNKIRRVSA